VKTWHHNYFVFFGLLVLRVELFELIVLLVELFELTVLLGGLFVLFAMYFLNYFVGIARCRHRGEAVNS